MEMQLGNKNYKELVHACQEMPIKQSKTDSVSMDDLNSLASRDNAVIFKNMISTDSISSERI